MKKINCRFYLLTFVFTTILSFSASAYNEDQQIWTTLTLQKEIQPSSNFFAYFESQGRHSFDQEKMYEYFFRPAVYFKAGEYGDYFVGYLKRYGPSSQVLEDRYWVQWSKAFNDLQSYNLALRLRQESRDLVGIDKQSLRTRLLFRLTHDEIKFDRLTPFFSHESLYQLNSVSAANKAGYAQSRTSVGTSISLTEKTTAEVAYLGVIVNNIGRADQYFHTLSMGLNHFF